MMLMMTKAPCCELHGGSNDNLLARICVQSSGSSSMLLLLSVVKTKNNIF